MVINSDEEEDAADDDDCYSDYDDGKDNDSSYLNWQNRTEQNRIEQERTEQLIDGMVETA